MSAKCKGSKRHLWEEECAAWAEAKNTFCQATEDTSLNTSHVHVPFVFSVLFKKCFTVKKNKKTLTRLKWVCLSLDIRQNEDDNSCRTKPTDSLWSEWCERSEQTRAEDIPTSTPGAFPFECDSVTTSELAVTFSISGKWVELSADVSWDFTKFWWFFFTVAGHSIPLVILLRTHLQFPQCNEVQCCGWDALLSFSWVLI